MNTQTETEQTETEQFYCEPSCECNTRMDIRARCDPVKSAPSFENCPAKVNTVYHHIINTYEEYKQYERYCEPGVRQDRNDVIASIAITDKYGLTGNEVDELLELFDKADEDDYKYNCILCDDFVFACDEENCRIDGDEEGLICWNCIPEHFCEDCDEFYAGVIEPNICGKYICDDCEESRLNAFKEAEQEKADKKKEIKKKLIEAWRNIKNDMEEWVYDYTTDDTSSIDDLKELVSALNVMLNEIGTEPLDL